MGQGSGGAGRVWFGLGLVWFGLGLVWFGLVWFGLVWFGLVWRMRFNVCRAPWGSSWGTNYELVWALFCTSTACSSLRSHHHRPRVEIVDLQLTLTQGRSIMCVHVQIGRGGWLDDVSVGLGNGVRQLQGARMRLMMVKTWICLARERVRGVSTKLSTTVCVLQFVGAGGGECASVLARCVGGCGWSTWLGWVGVWRERWDGNVVDCISQSKWTTVCAVFEKYTPFCEKNVKRSQFSVVS
jgi:hypothetical protein